MTKHGLCKTKEYNAWSLMKHRCSNKNDKRYHRYGGRGIVVCKRWLEFGNFFADMGGCPNGLTLERIDNNGNYCPENCKWASQREQHNNKCSSVFITYRGVTRTMAEWSRAIGMGDTFVRDRRKRGFSVKDIFEKPSQRYKPIKQICLKF